MRIVNTSLAPAAIGPYSQAVIAGNFVYTSGQIAIDPCTGLISGKDISTQTELLIKNIETILKASGSSLAKVVKTTCYLQSMSHFAYFNSVYEKYFTGKPARSCVEVTALPKNALVDRKSVV